jgi:hypothetical protein
MLIGQRATETVRFPRVRDRQQGEIGMDEAPTMSWKTFTIRLIEALRWPAAFVAAVVILREPFTQLVQWITGGGLA